MLIINMIVKSYFIIIFYIFKYNKIHVQSKIIRIVKINHEFRKITKITTFFSIDFPCIKTPNPNFESKNVDNKTRINHP